MGKFINLTGQEFCRGRALRPTESRQSGSVVWQMECQCGRIYFANSGDLKAGKVKSCGCLQRQNGIRLRNHNRLRGIIKLLKKSKTWRSDMACIRIIQATLNESETLS